MQKLGTAEVVYSIDFREQGKKFCLHYNRGNSYVFVNSVKPINSREKIPN